MLDTLLETMRANEAGTRADTDSEFLHDYRVAVRRTRSVLGMAVRRRARRTCSTTSAAEFKWLGDITTPTRDLDVYLLEYPGLRGGRCPRRSAPTWPLRGFLARTSADAHDELVRELDSPRYAALARRGTGAGCRRPAA